LVAIQLIDFHAQDQNELGFAEMMLYALSALSATFIQDVCEKADAAAITRTIMARICLPVKA